MFCSPEFNDVRPSTIRTESSKLIYYKHELICRRVVGRSLDVGVPFVTIFVLCGSFWKERAIPESSHTYLIFLLLREIV